MPTFRFVITTTFKKTVSFEAKNAEEADDILKNEYLDNALDTEDFETEYHAIPDKVACVGHYYAFMNGRTYEISEAEFDKYKLEGSKDVNLADIQKEEK